MRLAVAVTTAVGLLAGASAASAATVTVDGTTLHYEAAAGKTSTIGFTQAGATSPDTVSVYRGVDASGSGFPGFDDDTITPGAGCAVVASGGPNEHFDCTGVSSVVANLGDGNDTATGGAFVDASSTPQTGLVSVVATFNGGDDADGLVGGAAGDTLNGDNGADTLDGGAGEDVLTGGVGIDTIDGEAGNDTADGGAGNDTIFDSGLQDLVGSPAAFTSNDTLNGGDGVDMVSGGDGNDTVSGGEGDDLSLSGGQGSDTVNGDAGDDAITADTPVAGSTAPVSDTYNGGTGTDSVSYAGYASDVTLSLDGVANDGQANEGDNVSAENLTGGSGNDTITGSDLANGLTGGGGTDTISGAGGNDVLSGGDAADTLSGGEGSDTFSGGSGNDTLNGDNGDDNLAGDSGDDVFNGGAGTDTANYGGGFLISAAVTVTLDGVANDGAADEKDNADADKQVENIVGGFGNDTLTGNAAVNYIDGSFGDDVINAVDGQFLTDVVVCGDGYDTAAGDALDYIESIGSARCEARLRAPITRAASTTSLRVTPRRDKTAPFKFTAKGKVAFAGVPVKNGCKGSVVVTYRAGNVTLAVKRAKVSSTCSYKTSASVRLPKRYHGKKKMTVIARFAGNRFVDGSVAPVRKPQAG